MISSTQTSNKLKFTGIPILPRWTFEGVDPVLSIIGWVLPVIFSGEVLVSLVLGIQTTGPLLLHDVLAQDIYLAGSIVLILSVLIVIDTLILDILLAWLDPLIRYGSLSR